eukprot:3296457-Alexandrium_andersonii.AAC.1
MIAVKASSCSAPGVSNDTSKAAINCRTSARLWSEMRPSPASAAVANALKYCNPFSKDAQSFFALL